TCKMHSIKIGVSSFSRKKLPNSSYDRKSGKTSPIFFHVTTSLSIFISALQKTAFYAKTLSQRPVGILLCSDRPLFLLLPRHPDRPVRAFNNSRDGVLRRSITSLFTARQHQSATRRFCCNRTSDRGIARYEPQH